MLVSSFRYSCVCVCVVVADKSCSRSRYSLNQHECKVVFRKQNADRVSVHSLLIVQDNRRSACGSL